jgi:hypothetical protein
MYDINCIHVYEQVVSEMTKVPAPPYRGRLKQPPVLLPLEHYLYVETHQHWEDHHRLKNLNLPL